MPLSPPDENGHISLLTAAEAIARSLCPECGESLKVVNPLGHMRTHWMGTPPADRRGDEARKRLALLQQFCTDNKIRTTNMPAPKVSGLAPEPPTPAPSKK